jgi:RNA polymerase sigma-70 factor (ECF subfamily)
MMKSAKGAPWVRSFLSWRRKPCNEAQEVALCRKAFAEMVRRHEVELLRVAQRLCGRAHGGEDHARDLVQDAVVAAYEAVLEGKFVAPQESGTPEAHRRERAYLLRILTNRFINGYRRQKKWDAGVTIEDVTIGGEIAPLPSLQANAVDKPDENLLSQTLEEPLERALLSLSEGLRVCVILVEIEGLEYAEAAAVLNIPVGTVRSRLSRARVQLQELLQDYARQHRLL